MSASKNNNEKKVRVVVRTRPMNERESASGHKNCISISNTSGDVKKVSQDISLVEEFENSFGEKHEVETSYKFDACYGETSKQSEIFNREIKPELGNIFKAQNTTVFCYGMTGTGKSHTMQGPPNDPGIIPRTIEKVLKLAASSKKVTNVKFSMSFLEIYNEKVYDLLPESNDTRKELPLRENYDNEVVVANLSSYPFSSKNDFDVLYRKGLKYRKTASTKLNKRSSRSHSMLIIRVTYNNCNDRTKVFQGKLHLIDLAGNEDNRITGNEGERMNESNNINKSLFVLGNVINALKDGNSRVPYRDSKLTRLLQDSLGGPNYAVMICTISPSSKFQFYTARTLTYGSGGLQIVNEIRKNVTSIEENQSMDVPQKCPSLLQIGGKAARVETLPMKEKLEQWKSKKEKKPRNSTTPLSSSLPTTKIDVYVAQPISASSASSLTSSLTSSSTMCKSALKKQKRMEAIHDSAVEERKKLSPSTNLKATIDSSSKGTASFLGQATDLLSNPSNIVDLSALTNQITNNPALQNNPEIAHQLQRVADEFQKMSSMLLNQSNTTAQSTEASIHKSKKRVKSHLNNQSTYSESSKTMPFLKMKAARSTSKSNVSSADSFQIKEYIQKAKEYISCGKYTNALAAYNMAASLAPHSDKLRAKVVSVQKMVQMEKSKERGTMSHSDSCGKRKPLGVITNNRPVKTIGLEKENQKPNRVPALETPQVNEVVLNRLLEILNTADAKDLKALKTIGKVRAEKIFESREDDGLYKNVQDLGRIGLSEKQIHQFIEQNQEVV